MSHEAIPYQTEDREAVIRLRVWDESIPLSRVSIAELFEVMPRAGTRYICALG